MCPPPHTVFRSTPEQSRKGSAGGVCTRAEVEPRAAIRKGLWQEERAWRCLERWRCPRCRAAAALGFLLIVQSGKAVSLPRFTANVENWLLHQPSRGQRGGWRSETAAASSGETPPADSASGLLSLRHLAKGECPAGVWGNGCPSLPPSLLAPQIRCRVMWLASAGEVTSPVLQWGLAVAAATAEPT